MATSRERQNEYQRRYYRKNKAAFLERNRQKKLRLRERIAQAKDRPCTDCGHSYPSYVMDFDHRDPRQKLFTIADLPRVNSIEKLEIEIAKCDIVCANCHRIRTHGIDRGAILEPEASAD